jgi:hypothetical protein
MYRKIRRSSLNIVVKALYKKKQVAQYLLNFFVALAPARFRAGKGLGADKSTKKS